MPAFLKNFKYLNNILLYLILQFTVIGLWHGFKSTFIVYGLLQAFMIWIYLRVIRRHSTNKKIGLLGRLCFIIICLNIPALIFISKDLNQFFRLFYTYNFGRAIYFLNMFLFLSIILVSFIFEKYHLKIKRRFLKLNFYWFYFAFLFSIFLILIFGGASGPSFTYSNL